MDEHTFWSIVATLEGAASKKAIRRFRQRLEGLTPDDVTAFGDELSAKLYALDTEAHYQQPMRTEDMDEDSEDLDKVDSDLFDSLRCAVVLAGPEIYQDVLIRPAALSEHVWDQAWEADRLIEVLDDVHEKRGIGTGSYSPKYPLATGSNPLGFHDAVVPTSDGGVPTTGEWLLLSYSYEDDHFLKKWDTKKNWPRFETPVLAALEELRGDSQRQAAFSEIGIDRVLLSLDLYPPTRKPGVRVRRVGTEIEVSIATSFRLEDPTPREIQAWAADAFTAAIDTALSRAQKKT
jgi:Protein of unknown function (DUF4240)